MRNYPLFAFTGLVIACGGRSALDENGPWSGAGGSAPNSGGRPSGGAGSGGTGGISSGGAGGISAGGSGGSAPTCADGTFGNGRLCEPWTTCAAGEYVLMPGTPTANRECAPCPEGTFSAGFNQPACVYSGCAFSEQVVSAPTPSSRARCAADPGYVDLGEAYDRELLGLARIGERPYVGLTNSYETAIDGYDDQTLVDPLAFLINPYERPTSFTLAADGTVYLTGLQWKTTNPPIWLEEHVPGGGLRRSSFGVSSNVESPRIIATDSHWIHAYVEWTGDEPALRLTTSPQRGSIPNATTLPLYAGSVEAVDPQLIWISAVGDGTESLEVGAVRDLTPTFEAIKLPHSFIPRRFAPTSAGGVYVVGNTRYAYESVEILEIDADGTAKRSWNFFTAQGDSLIPAGIGIDEDRAVFVSCTHFPGGIGEYPVSGQNVVVIRLDLITGERSFKEFIGPSEDWVTHQVVTTDGALYIAGGTDASYYLRKAF